MKKKQVIFASVGLALGLRMVCLAIFIFPERAGTAGNSTPIGVGVGLVGTCSVWLILYFLYHCTPGMDDQVSENAVSLRTWTAATQVHFKTL